MLEGQKGILLPETVDRLLKAAGFKPAPMVMVTDRMALSETCRTIGFPLAIKVMGPVHKSEVGGVKTGVAGLDQARTLHGEIMKIPEAFGVLLQEMISGTEMILGVTREEQFGHLIMFGLGGIYTEVLKDVQFALTPLTASESLEMVQSIKNFPILKGTGKTLYAVDARVMMDP